MACAVQRGFTLVELMVALFITAILFAMGYGAINQVSGQYSSLEAQQARLLAVQTAMRTLAQDFEQATARPVRQPVGNQWQAAFESQAAVAGLRKIPALVTLTRGGWANPAGVQRPALQRVSYFVREQRPEPGTLAGARHDAGERARAPRTADRRQVDRSLRYMDAPGHWIDRWPALDSISDQSMPNQPERSHRTRPLAVEVTLELEDWGKIMRIFEVPQ